MSEAERMAAYLKSTGNPLQMAAGDMITELLRRIKELEAKMPKEGVWEGIEYDGYADGYPVYDVWECSECKEEHNGEKDTLPNYCPNCGSRMRTVTDCHTLEKGGGNA